jgi:hypothetical protein
MDAMELMAATLEATKLAELREPAYSVTARGTKTIGSDNTSTLNRYAVQTAVSRFSLLPNRLSLDLGNATVAEVVVDACGDTTCGGLVIKFAAEADVDSNLSNFLDRRSGTLRMSGIGVVSTGNEVVHLGLGTNAVVVGDSIEGPTIEAISRVVDGSFMLVLYLFFFEVSGAGGLQAS